MVTVVKEAEARVQADTCVCVYHSLKLYYIVLGGVASGRVSGHGNKAPTKLSTVQSLFGVQQKDAAQLETPQLPVLILGHHRLFEFNLEQMKSRVKSEQKRQKGMKN